MKIGIVGYGRFGRLTAGYLSQRFPVVVSSRSRAAGPAGGGRIRFAGLEEVCRQDVVVLAVPISALDELLARAAPLMRRGALVVDVASVKELPVAWMLRRLPETVDILATHPMFGPDSAAESLAGHKIVLCPVRIDRGRLERISRWLAAAGLAVIETTPEEHDRQIAVTLALTHFIGRSLAEFGAGDLPIDTEGYKRLRHILGVVENDTWQLFEDMNTYNAHAAATRSAFLAAMGRIDRRLAGIEKG